MQGCERILPESLQATESQITPTKHKKTEEKSSVFQSAAINTNAVKLESDLPYSSIVPNSRNKNGSNCAAAKLTDSHVLFGVRKES